ncbi:MAG: type II toxin-antitoxin system RelE/ParE family toxin [Campylobacterota bacterium]|nr:type II toxin-antitoxin system RelE/ParE family toxin [Campylobacterota bacterium]
MKVNFSHESKEFIFKLKAHIALDNPSRAKSYAIKLVSRIKDMLQHPYIGKVNATFDDETVREVILDGIKIIYKIYPKSVAVVMIYRYIDFDESDIELT